MLCREWRGEWCVGSATRVVCKVVDTTIVQMRLHASAWLNYAPPHNINVVHGPAMK